MFFASVQREAVNLEDLGNFNPQVGSRKQTQVYL